EDDIYNFDSVTEDDEGDKKQEDSAGESRSGAEETSPETDADAEAPDKPERS
ncbi:MAG: hypothetical protein JJ979_21075, partial [Roseibium sp.]|nr:hypothetical protein [Roseibium sp.]